MLRVSRTPNFIVVPAELAADKALDYWLHIEFEFNAEKTEVVVASWAVTNSAGDVTNLSELSYDTFVDVAQALASECKYAQKFHYDELEAEHYENQAERNERYRLDDI